MGCDFCEYAEDCYSEKDCVYKEDEQDYIESMKREFDPCEICPNNQIDTCVYIENDDRKSCSIVKEYLSKEE